MSARDYQHYLQRGTASLTAFLGAKYDTFAASQKVEMSFAHQQSTVGDAVLTGALDLVDIDEEARTMIVTDYKTGSASRGWNGKSDAEKLKLHRYRQQLMFYKLLVEHSRDFASYRVDAGALQFVEPTADGDIVTLTTDFADDDLEEFTTLVETTYRHITALTLPEVSR